MRDTITDDTPPPPWARWKACDRDGETFYFSHRPRLGDRIWHRSAGRASLAGITNVHLIDWRQSLTEIQASETELLPILPPTRRVTPPISPTFHEGVLSHVTANTG